jgi:hypothetical protein
MHDLLAMNHLDFIAAAYAVGILLPGYFAVAAWTRMAQARRRLDAIDPRRLRPPQARGRDAA